MRCKRFGFRDCTASKCGTRRVNGAKLLLKSATVASKFFLLSENRSGTPTWNSQSFMPRNEVRLRAAIERALDAGVPFGWVAGDEVYGNNSKLRQWLEYRQLGYVLAVASDQRLRWPDREQRRVDAIAQSLPVGHGPATTPASIPINASPSLTPENPLPRASRDYQLSTTVVLEVTLRE